MLNFKSILMHNDIITTEDILTINYFTNSGRGRLNINMFDFFPAAAGKIKLVIDTINKSEDSEKTARVLYDYLVKCVDFLTKARDLCKKNAYNDREKKEVAEYTAEIKRYTNNINALCKVYNFVAAADPDAVKMTRCDVVAREYKAGAGFIIKGYKGYKFIKYGHVFHVYKGARDIFIIIPCCGQACTVYNGTIKTAPEYITPELIEKLNKIDFTALHKELLNDLETATNIILNNDIYDIYTAATAADPKPAKKAPAAADAPKPETKTDKEQTAENKQNQARPENIKKAPKTPRPAAVNAPEKRHPRPPYYITTAGILKTPYNAATTAKKPPLYHSGINTRLYNKTPKNGLKTAYNARLAAPPGWYMDRRRPVYNTYYYNSS